jgi:hypothetical protein
VSADSPAAFFSYSREDEKFALQLAGDLKAAGANVWIDQLDIEFGQEWDSAVEDALARCPRMLLILSPASVKSKNVRDEVSRALRKEKTIIPVLHLDCDIPLRLERLHQVDFRTDYDRGVRLLLKALGVDQAVAASAAAAPPPAKDVHPASHDSGVRRLVVEQELQRRVAAEREHQEEERKQASPPELRDYKDGKFYFVFFSTVAYLDVFKVEHWTHFCGWTASASPPGEKIFPARPCTDYNGTDNN